MRAWKSAHIEKFTMLLVHSLLLFIREDSDFRDFKRTYQCLLFSFKLARLELHFLPNSLFQTLSDKKNYVVFLFHIPANSMRTCTHGEVDMLLIHSC